MQNHVLFMHWVSEVRGVRSLGVDEEHTVCYCSARTPHTFFSPRSLSHPLSSLHLSPLLPLLFVKDLVLLLFISQSESLIIVERCYTVSSFSALGLKLMWNKSLFKPKSVSFPFYPFRCVSPMLLAPEAWGEVSQAQAPMGRPVTQHALLLLQCMLVLLPGGVAGRRGPVLLPESPCHKTEHPLIPHSGKCSNKHTGTCTHQGDIIDLTNYVFFLLFPPIIMWNLLLAVCTFF